jgi:hypothetical protein
MHFEPINAHNLRIKYAWYMCMQRLRNPKVSAKDLNEFYASLLDDSTIELKPVHSDWLTYSFFDEKAYHAQRWEEGYVMRWIKEYGKDYFADLNIWDFNVAWN